MPIDGQQRVHLEARENQFRGSGWQRDDEEDAERGEDFGGGEQH